MDSVDVGLDTLRAEIGSDPAFRRILQVFLADAPRLLVAMDQDLEIGDRAALTLHAHRLNGAARSMRLEELAQACTDVEDRCRGGDLVTVDLGRVSRSFDAAAPRIREHLPDGV
jgi:HPt (histidine-containing phosphotransfer) domain-containing protein